MRNQISRRVFLKRSSTLTAGLSICGGLSLARAATKGPNEKVLVGIIGCNGRGMDHIAGYLREPNAEIIYVCDVDSRARERGVAAVQKKQQRTPKGATDLRQMLEDKDLDAVSIATPDHWHAPAAILACKAGKHVYVEKPGSHNPHESQLLVEAAGKYGRRV